MNIIELQNGKIHPIEILPIEIQDFKILNSNRYFFNWKEEIKFEIYKLCIEGKNDILGLMSLQRIPTEWRVHIRLLTVSSENKGQHKLYDKIAGNLIAFAAKISVSEYNALACISLRPKSTLFKHYIKKYKMNITGQTLSLELPEILNLINTYDYEV